MSEEILKKYVCTNPFNYLDIQGNGVYVCCPSWCPTSIGDSKDLNSTIDSKIAKDIQGSMMDGLYSFCDKKICPSLSMLIHTGEVSNNFVPIELFKVEEYVGPEEVLFGFDRSCNLKCPSCRSEVVHNDKIESDEHNRKLEILESIETNLSGSLKKILITGSGDPLFSKIYRDYLLNFDITQYPKLKAINLITNGNLLNEKTWHQMKASPYIKNIEISVDAGKKETYESVTRLNGNWGVLIENLKFLSTVDTIDGIIVSMVVGTNNYQEMLLFYNLIDDIFKNSKIDLVISFRQIVYWASGAYSPLQIRELQCFEKGHDKFEDFLSNLKSIHGKPHVSHNFHHLL